MMTRAKTGDAIVVCSRVITRTAHDERRTGDEIDLCSGVISRTGRDKPELVIRETSEVE